MSKVISRGKLDEQRFFLRDLGFAYTHEYIQMLIDQICIRDERIHRLEHVLMSCRDFIQNPAIAGVNNTCYVEGLYAMIEELLQG